MTSWNQRTGLLVGLALLAAWQLTSGAQQPDAQQPGDGKQSVPQGKAETRFHFDVVESFNAKYLGDTPGHTGRAGGLDNVRPNVALGDPVYRDDDVIGTVTSIVWSRPQGSLTIEFDPKPLLRIAVGDAVWVYLNSPAGKPTE